MSKVDKMFDKAAFGYKPEDVDNYIEQQNYRIAALEAEKSELQEKMQVLAEKINQYRADEADLKDALLGAQKLRNTILAEAKTKSEDIIAAAEAEALKMRADAKRMAEETVETVKREADKEKIRLAKIQREVADFKSRLLSIYKNHLSVITNLPDMDEELEAFYENQKKAAAAALTESEIKEEEEKKTVEEISAAVADSEKEQDAKEEEKPAAETQEARPTVQFHPGEAKSAFEQKYGELRFGKHNESR